MKTKKRALFASLLMLVAALFCALPAYAESVYAPSVSMVVEGHTYTCLTAFAAVGNGRVTAGTTVGTSVQRPAGYIGSQTCILNPSGVLVASDLRYSTSNLASVTSSASTSAPVGLPYRAFGRMYIYQTSNGQYATKETPYTPIQIVRALIRPTGCQGIMENGMRYGTLAEGKLDGDGLDLIQAIASNGCQGYVLSEDLFRDTPESPSEAVKQFAVETTESIPVYDLDWNIVGYFPLTTGPAI